MRSLSAIARLGIGLIAMVLGSIACARSAEEPKALASAVCVEPGQPGEQWSRRVFARAETVPAAVEASSHLTILEQSHKVLQNRTVWDTPLTLGAKEHAQGIFMDAPASVLVELSRPAVELTAEIGIDDNPNTRAEPQPASARFHVIADGQRKFTSPVYKRTDGGHAIRVPLGGTRRFVLEVDDGGDGRTCDQCVWADAQVRLDDGTSLALGKLPLASGRPNRSNVAFSFLYGGVPSDQLLPGWEFTERAEPLAAGMRRALTYQCPKTGLRIQCEVVTYTDCDAVDWVMTLTNEAAADTPIIEKLLPLDADLVQAEPDQPVTLRWSNGDGCSPVSFLPHDEPLASEQERQFAPHGGRSSNGEGGGALPFFNLLGPESGWILAVGWSGQWNAAFTRQAGRVAVRAGMQTTSFRLRPGERVRSPRIVLLPYQGNRMTAGHNRFRRLLVDHYVQRRDGEPAAPPVCHNTAATIYRSGQRANEQNQLAILRKAASMGVEAYWMDAYWYPQPWDKNVGNWHPRPEDFPGGLKPLADAAHAAGMKFVLWFEPERVYQGTDFERDHPEFLFPQGDSSGNRLFNLGDPKARQFLTDFLDGRIKEWAVDVYRNDFNFDPLPYWQLNDAADRRGISEMLYVEGLYRMWSDLLQRNPGLTIDNCASGGRRIDVELCSLSWPLWRSDFNDIGEGLKGPQYWPRMAVADQNHVAGLALYLPFQSGPLWDMRPYSLRSAMTSSIVLYEQILPEEFPADVARQGIAELKRLRPLFLGDFYPLAPFNDNQASWFACQFDRPEIGQGVALFFRRPESSEMSRHFVLEGIDPEATYDVTVAGETYQWQEARRMSGRALKEQSVQIPEQPGSALIHYALRN